MQPKQYCAYYIQIWYLFVKKSTIQWVQYNVRCSAKENSNVKVALHSSYHIVRRLQEQTNRQEDPSPVVTRDDEFSLQRLQRRTGQSSRRSPVSVLDTVSHQFASVETQRYLMHNIHAQSWNICPQVKCRLILPLHRGHQGVTGPDQRPPVGPWLIGGRMTDIYFMFGLVYVQGRLLQGQVFETQLIRYCHSGQSKTHRWMSAHA